MSVLSGSLPDVVELVAREDDLAKQRELPAEDWQEQDTLACFPDREKRLIMRTERSASASCRPRS
jgi:hypothetical protein